MDEPIIKTGFIDLDRIIGGLYPGELMVIGAPPSMGKTSFLAALIRNITWKHGTKALMFSVEKPIESFRKYLVSTISGLPISIIGHRLEKLSEEEFEVYKMYSFEVENLPMFIDDTPEKTINDLCESARKKVCEDGVEIIYIDNPEFIYTDSGYAAIDVIFCEVMIKLKQLAKELNVPIVTTRCVGRTVEPDPPLLSLFSLKGIENIDVILLFTEQRIKYEMPSPHIETLKIKKNCFGETGEIKVRYFLDTVCFDNLESAPEYKLPEEQKSLSSYH